MYTVAKTWENSGYLMLRNDLLCIFGPVARCKYDVPRYNNFSVQSRVRVWWNKVIKTRKSKHDGERKSETAADVRGQDSCRSNSHAKRKEEDGRVTEKTNNYGSIVTCRPTYRVSCEGRTDFSFGRSLIACLRMSSQNEESKTIM